MLNVSNRKCIRRLGLRSMAAARTRNVVAILAIALTTILFTSLFTIVASMNASFQQQNFRQAGGDFHGTFKRLSLEQVEELRTDPLIEEDFARYFLGMPADVPFNKTHVEVSYLEPASAPHYFCTPQEGTLPQEGTNQAATDTRVLNLLGVEPRVGETFTISYYINFDTPKKQLVTRTYTLSGWWEYDSAVVASNVLVPRSEVDEICTQYGADPDSITGEWSLDVMFKDSLHIEENLLTILANHGYQAEDAQGENYIGIGVNWGYTGAQLVQKFEPTTLLGLGAFLVLIIFTGYLIIYNIFQISVNQDIRFYGLLKTIGTTGRQIKRIVRQQALLLSCAGIPIGLLLGFLAGNKLTPVILSRTYLSGGSFTVDFNPWIFIGATLFSLVTVFLSCARPGRMAAKVSPVEAVRYTEGGGSKRKDKKGSAKKGASLPRMAWANLGRSKSKTVVTVLSLTLAVVLLTVTFTFSGGFDMNKYLARNADVDFILADADYFHVNSGGFRSAGQALPEEVIQEVLAQGGVTDYGRTYGQTSSIMQFVTEDWYRKGLSQWNSQETVDWSVEHATRNEDGLLLSGTLLYGMEDLPLSHLNVLAGDLAPLSDPSQNAVAAVYEVDDYNRPYDDSHWAKVGDTVTLRYVTEWEYYYTDTGEVIEDFDAYYDSQSDRTYGSRPVAYEDREYTVCAQVTVSQSLNYRYYGTDQYILGAERFVQDTGTSDVMHLCFNTTDEAEPEMESFLAEYTGTVQPTYDYESRASYVAEFEGFRGTVVTLGGALSFIVGLVGVLNFINAELTGILSRKREFAVLQSIGMTGKQLKTMLVFEGLYYTLLSLALCLVLTVAGGPLLGNALNNLFWFFTYKFTVIPVALMLPVFLVLGVVVPLVTYRVVARRTIVERLREAEV